MAEEIFEPADFSMQELHFLVEHLGETPNVALHGAVPPGVNPDAIRPALRRFCELEELRTLRRVPWAGYDAIRESIARFAHWHLQSLEIQAAGGPRYPSMFSWDSTGAMYAGGIGSDSTEKVRHEILPDGSRRPFAVNLKHIERKSPNMPWVRNRHAPPPAPTTNGQHGGPALPHEDALRHENTTYFCTVCEKVVASYDRDGGRVAQAKARREAVKHCKRAKREIQRHRALAAMTVE